jgi:hypothetical protein
VPDHTAPRSTSHSGAASDVRPRGRRRSAAVIGALVVLCAAAVVTVSAVDVAQGRFSGTTNNVGSLFSTAVVDLELGADDTTSTASLLVDARNLTPIDEVVRCVAVRSTGSLEDARILLSGTLAGGSGLERYVATEIDRGTGADPECSDFSSGETIFTGSLLELAERPEPFVLLADAPADSTTTVRLSFRLLDDDRAQGLDTEFWLSFEARA